MLCQAKYKSGFLTIIICIVVNVTASGQQNRASDSLSGVRVAFFKEIKNPESIKRKPSFWGKLKKVFSGKSSPQFVRPLGLDVRDGILAVADPGAGGVHLLDSENQELTFVMTNSERSSGNSPVDVAVAENRLYVTYSGTEVIDIFTFNGEFIAEINPAISIAKFTGVCSDPPDIVAVDTQNHTALVIDGAGNILQKIGIRGERAGAFNFPTFVTVSTEGNIYVSDTMNFRVQVFNRNGEWTKTFSERGTKPGQLNRPKGIAVDSDENLYVVDASFDNIQVFSPDGEFLLYLGKSGKEAGQFIMPTDIAIDNGYLYVSDTGNQRIQIFKVKHG